MLIFVMEVIVVLDKSKQWMCKFIVLFIFITGMCFEEIKADPVFVCTIISEQTLSQQDTSEEEQMMLCLDESNDVTQILAARSTSSTQQLIAPMTNGKRTVKLSVVLIYVIAFWLLLSNSYARSYVTQLPERVCKTIVVNYIHNTDGKKRM